jgi:hypothetical protein
LPDLKKRSAICGTSIDWAGHFKTSPGSTICQGLQFLNLFFSNVYQLDSATYSAFGSASYVLVFIMGLIVPEVRRHLGWRGAILGVQSAAVVMLALMGLTELWKHTSWALPVALVFFIFRQPLMNMAGRSSDGPSTMKHRHPPPQSRRTSIKPGDEIVLRLFQKRAGDHFRCEVVAAAIRVVDLAE